MRTSRFGAAALLGVLAWGCGATTTRDRHTTVRSAATLSSATVTFMTRDEGKDEDSAVAIQLLDEGTLLSADGSLTDLEFDEASVSAPLTLTVMRPVSAADLHDARLRLRLTPDGRDTWVFDLRLAVRLSDGAERQYFWSGIRLDESAPERTLALASGEVRR